MWVLSPTPAINSSASYSSVWAIDPHLTQPEGR